MTPPPADEPRHSPAAPSGAGVLERLDTAMAAHLWHPRVTPFFVYILGLMLVGLARDAWPWSYPIGYGIQCALVAALLWRYRKLTPELTVSFHWLAIPVGVFVFAAWVWLGMWVSNFDRIGFHDLGRMTGDLLASWNDPSRLAPYADPAAKTFQHEMGGRAGTIALYMRLLGMSLLVPMFEELFIRSLMLRSLHSGRRTMLGLAQMFEDVPVVGEWFVETRLGQRVTHEPPVHFGQEFERTPLGALSVFGVAASTLVFGISHQPRDYAGVVVCGVAYCLLVGATARKGLGPVIWAHGITNALLWAYTVRTGDWRFL